MSATDIHPQPIDAPSQHERNAHAKANVERPRADPHAAYYAARASEYDVSVGYGTPLVERHLASLQARLQADLKGHDALELACGTGYWTGIVAATARSVLATDRDAASLALAQARMASSDHVRCQHADAYSLEGVAGPFSAAFALFWWSHMPKSKIPAFLSTLHGKLTPGARVVFADQLPYEWHGKRRCDDEGNLLEERALLDGTRFEIVKNFPTEAELAGLLTGIAEQPVYSTGADGRWWMISYRTAS
ncbi:class I SAM-dependent methyltransferase [Paraburkholderia fungorum]|uniref:class I SAM-dependent methyltransferase n=1 Tax=Paraburkholderia fungorum TaxID=134537 RepID=UPI0038B74C1E